jgi:peptide/nickel transport system substrate-binding protein
MILSPFYAAPTGVQATNQFEGRYGGTLRIAYGSDPIGWNPVINYWSTSMYYYINCFVKGYRFDDLYNIVGYACEGSPEFEATAEYPSIYTWTLKDGVMWHDGTPLTTQDIKFTYETHAWGASDDPMIDEDIRNRLELPQYHSNTYFHALDKIEVVNDKVIKFYFNEVTLDSWISEMNSNVILPYHIYKDFNTNNPAGQTFEDNPYNLMPVGSGPYQVTEFERDQFTVMERFDDYFDGVPYLQTLVWNVITDPTAAMLALENGEIDTVHEQLNFPAAEIDRVNSDPQFSVDAFPYTTTWRVTPNFHPEALATWPWVGDVEVRKAMEYAIDKETIVDQVLNGITRPTSTAVSWIVAPYGGDYNTDEFGYTGDWKITPRNFDPDMARTVLDAAGWTLNGDGVRHKVIDGVDHKIEGVEMPYYHYATAWGEAIASNWADVGIFVNPVPIESTTFFQGIEVTELGLQNPAVGGPYPLGLNTMGGGPDPDQVNGWIRTRPAWGPGWEWGGDNFGFYSNERVDELFDIGASTAVYAERKAAYDELQYLVHEDAGFIMLWNKWKVEAWNNDFTGFGSNRPIAWYGGYFRGNDESSNVEKGVYWRGGTVNPGGDVTTIMTTSIMTTATTVSEFMDLRILAAFTIVMAAGIFAIRRRRREE